MSDGESENQIGLSTTGEVATDAALSVAKAAGRGLLDGVEETSKDFWGLIAGDLIAQWRLRNQVRVLEKTASLFKAKGIPIENAQHLPNGEMLLIFEGMSKTDEEELSSLWARLLAEGMTSNEKIHSKMASSTLEQMSSDVALLFQQLALIEKVKVFDQATQQSRMSAFFEEQKALSNDDDYFAYDRTGVSEAIENGWKTILEDKDFSRDYLQSLTDELLRLNLIQHKQSAPNFDSNPFGTGMRLTEAGVDEVLADMQAEMQRMVEQAAGHVDRSLFAYPEATNTVQYELSPTGKNFARALGLF